MAKKIKEFLKYQLEPGDLEHRYRVEKLANDKVQAIAIIALGFFVIIGFIFLDYHVLQKGISLYASITSRCAAVIISLLAAWMLYRQSMTRSFDLIVLSWAMVVISHAHCKWRQTGLLCRYCRVGHLCHFRDIYRSPNSPFLPDTISAVSHLQ